VVFGIGFGFLGVFREFFGSGFWYWFWVFGSFSGVFREWFLVLVLGFWEFFGSENYLKMY